MTLITGQILLNELEEKGKYEEDEAAQLFWKILSGISHIHSCNVIHRDIKPENIMIDENNEPVIIDFGLSKDSSDPCMVLKSFVGSKIYMAPEIVIKEQKAAVIAAVSNEKKGYRCFPADIWALGVLLYVLL